MIHLFLIEKHTSQTTLKLERKNCCIFCLPFEIKQKGVLLVQIILGLLLMLYVALVDREPPLSQFSMKQTEADVKESGIHAPDGYSFTQI